MKRGGFESLTCRFILCSALLTTLPGCVKLPRRAQVAAHTKTQGEVLAAKNVSLNRASRAELERLPGVGPGLAWRVIEHRERYGPFRRAEHLLLVRGFGERRFRDVRPYITAE